MASAAFWLQTGDPSNDHLLLLTIFVGIIAFAFLIIGIAAAVIAAKTIAFMADAKKFFDETKVKAMPIIEKATDITHIVQGVVADMAPKVKIISENAVEMSHTVRGTVTKLDVTVRDVAEKAAATFYDVNDKTKQQVARVDGMVSSTLGATAELGETVNQGIRTPARKIAAMVAQSKHAIDTLIDRAKALGINIGDSVQAKVNPKTRKGSW